MIVRSVVGCLAKSYHEEEVWDAENKKTSGAHDMDAKNVYHLGSATFFDKTVLMKSWRRESQSMSHVRLTVREEQGHCNQLMKKKKGTF